jgi:hypothetical protein
VGKAGWALIFTGILILTVGVFLLYYGDDKERSDFSQEEFEGSQINIKMFLLEDGEEFTVYYDNIDGKDATRLRKEADELGLDPESINVGDDLVVTYRWSSNLFSADFDIDDLKSVDDLDDLKQLYDEVNLQDGNKTDLNGQNDTWNGTDQKNGTVDDSTMDNTTLNGTPPDIGTDINITQDNGTKDNNTTDNGGTTHNTGGLFVDDEDVASSGDDLNFENLLSKLFGQYETVGMKVVWFETPTFVAMSLTFWGIGFVIVGVWFRKR